MGQNAPNNFLLSLLRVCLHISLLEVTPPPGHPHTRLLERPTTLNTGPQATFTPALGGNARAAGKCPWCLPCIGIKSNRAWAGWRSGRTETDGRIQVILITDKSIQKRDVWSFFCHGAGIGRLRRAPPRRGAGKGREQAAAAERAPGVVGRASFETNGRGVLNGGPDPRQTRVPERLMLCR